MLGVISVKTSLLRGTWQRDSDSAEIIWLNQMCLTPNLMTISQLHTIHHARKRKRAHPPRAVRHKKQSEVCLPPAIRPAAVGSFSQLPRPKAHRSEQTAIHDGVQAHHAGGGRETWHLAQVSCWRLFASREALTRRSVSSGCSSAPFKHQKGELPNLEHVWGTLLGCRLYLL